jgi:hypothetical protein
VTHAFRPLAEDINQGTGLIWKIWIENPETKEASRIYLFNAMEKATQ